MIVNETSLLLWGFFSEAQILSSMQYYIMLLSTSLDSMDTT